MRGWCLIRFREPDVFLFSNETKGGCRPARKSSKRGRRPENGGCFLHKKNPNLRAEDSGGFMQLAGYSPPEFRSKNQPFGCAVM
ncbi:MAG: hypothetical protein D6714_19670 [Bacteroidetes bacterium]|nr:MAG: hypothetical protein D6714_19670 [Bacteroidota bacterium]